MKRCPKCCLDKAPTDFAKKGNGLQSWCRACNKTQARAYYAANRETHVQKITARGKIAKAENQKRVYEYLLQHPCVDCGEANPLRLEFDHRGDKSNNVSALLAHYGWTAIEAEIAKCDVRCGSCHKEKTHREQNTYRWRFYSGSFA